MPRDLPPRSPLPDDVWLDHRADWQEMHDRFADAMDEALAEIERPETEPECPMCRGYGWLTVTDSRAPWREYRAECECCT